MKTGTKCFILTISLFAYGLSTHANDTIKMITKCVGGISHDIVIPPGKQLTVNWGDGSPLAIYTGTESGLLFLYHYYEHGRYEVTITANSEDCLFTRFGADRADTLDMSSCPSIEYIDFISWSARSLNVRNCINLKQLYISHNNLTVLDLRDNIALEDLVCNDNRLSRIDLAAIKEIDCIENRLPLSNLYAISEMISNPYHKYLGRQEFFSRRIVLGDTVDFSAEREFGGIQTAFYVEKGGAPAPPEDYTLQNGAFTFHKEGTYSIIMTNAAIVSHPGCPAVVVAPIVVIDFVAVQEIVNVPETAFVGVPLVLTGTVIPGNATHKGIFWSICDAGTTQARISTSTLYTEAPGTVIVRAKITEGAALYTNYTQDFVIQVVEPNEISEPATAGITLVPNPTTGELRIENGELRIENVEIFDVYGRTVGANLCVRPDNGEYVRPHTAHRTPQTALDISHLQAGIYFVRIQTETGIITKKIIKL